MVQDSRIFQENFSSPPAVARMVEDIIGCKWSLAVLEAVRNGVVRPGMIRRSIAGISTKVLNERLAKMTRYGLVTKNVFPQVPLRVEYRLTGFGEKFLEVLDHIARLQEELDRPSP